ncbi:hypothetical protein AAFC00_000372 [Neodothiora populina]|uniref:Uncharacterized protein n=1 Tax=Neodothiora populina TaxID=2781224 RepID=A0ABR3PCN4_9PEZI
MFSALRPRCLHAVESRAFSTSTRLSWKSHKNALAEAHENLPPYPHGPARWYKQSDKGLYGGQRVRFGNNVSKDTETKSRRTWHPNIMRKSLFSKALNRRIRVRVSTRVLRTIDKVGGLDEYLLGEKSARIRELGMEGWRLRCIVMATKSVQDRFNMQRVALGLPQVDYAALALETAEMPPELIGQNVEDSEFLVEEDQDVEEIASTGAESKEIGA